MGGWRWVGGWEDVPSESTPSRSRRASGGGGEEEEEEEGRGCWGGGGGGRRRDLAWVWVVAAWERVALREETLPERMCLGGGGGWVDRGERGGLNELL